MSVSEFNIFKTIQTESPATTQIVKLHTLRQQLYQANNDLVERIWEINLKLNRLNNPDEISILQENKENLENQVKTADYLSKITELNEVIRELEENEYGHSEIRKKSFYLP